MIYLAWVITVIISLFAGYYFRGLATKIEVLEKTAKTKIYKPQEEPESMLIDPNNEVQTALYEQKKMMEKLNPHE